MLASTLECGLNGYLARMGCSASQACFAPALAWSFPMLPMIGGIALTGASKISSVFLGNAAVIGCAERLHDLRRGALSLCYVGHGLSLGSIIGHIQSHSVYGGLECCEAG